MTEDGPEFRIERVRLRNYRSIAYCDVRLGPLTLLVGPNSSGKSNFLDALGFVADSLSFGPGEALERRGGIGVVGRHGGDRVHPFTIELQVLVDGRQAMTYYIGARPNAGEVDHVVEADWVATEPTRGSGRQVLPIPDAIGRIGGPLSDDESTAPATITLGWLRRISVLALNPDAMRGVYQGQRTTTLRRDGGNAAAVLARLQQNPPDDLDRIQEYLSLMVDGLERVHAVDLGGAGDYLVLEAEERTPGGETARFTAAGMSDGTLRALGVLLALFGPSRQALVCIEEPELALHPGAARVLLTAMREASDTRQVIATTHSPDLIDTPSVRPEDLLAVRRGADGSTEIGQVDDAGRHALAERLFTAGELLRADQLVPDPKTEPGEDPQS